MSGIAGILLKNGKRAGDNVRYIKSLDLMMESLVYDQKQLKHLYTDDQVFFGNAIPISSTNNDHFIKEDSLPYHIIVDGLVYIDNHEKEIMRKKYSIASLKDDYHYLPFLYDHYKNDFITHITGWFNIFIYNSQTKESLLVNDRLGYLPLYYYNSEDYLLFASKIESLLSSGLLLEISFDEVTMAEHMFFNYPLSDHTYITNIYTLPDASFLNLKVGQFNLNHYWDVRELFGAQTLDPNESFEVINKALRCSLNKPLKNTRKNFNFTLTGGWDSRLALSYLLPHNKGQLNTYSFGAPTSDDIRIPELIAREEGFRYTSFTLDQDYIDKIFLQCAKETIRLSNGTRNYKRSHYLYAIKNLTDASDTIITGIFGDEVLKVGKPQGGSVISQNAVMFINSGFNEKLLVKIFKDSKIPCFFQASSESLSDELESRLVVLKDKFKKYETTGQQYFAFRFSLNLRKYFGNEASSYNDFMYCYSPFIDYDFLKIFSRTKYMTSEYDFKKPSIKQKAQSSWLYYKLTNKNFPSLTNYPSTRGFSMKDSVKVLGIPKILSNKFFKNSNKKGFDGFNTRVTEQLFYAMLERNNFLIENNLFRNAEYDSGLENFYSLLYWASTVNKNYVG